MKKTHPSEVIDRNTNNVTTHLDRNLVQSHYFYHNEESTDVKIFELNSSKSPDSEDDIRNYNNHAWSYARKHSFENMKDKYIFNGTTRERRRTKNRISPEIVRIDSFNSTDEITDVIYTDFSNPNNNEDMIFNQQINHFAVINNNSDFSSDDFYNTDFETIQCSDLVLEYNYKNDNEVFSKDKIQTCDSNSVRDEQTIWIYSFKNRDILTDDVEPLNIPRKDYNFDSTSTSSSSEKKYEKPDMKNEYRLPTPTPTYIPRLNVYVAATLPTVTELPEPYKVISSDDICTLSSTNNTSQLQKPINSWMEVNHIYAKNIKFITIDPGQKHMNNVIDWLTLSPRIRKRNLKLPKLSEDNALNSNTNASYFNRHKIIFNKESITNDEESGSVLPHFKEQNNSKANVNTGKTRDKDLFKIDERGAYIKIQQKPHVLLNSSIINETSITGPIENLSDKNWIEPDETRVKEAKHEIVFDSKKINHESFERCTNDTLLMKNISPSKPAQWTKYLPITDKIPSLELSLQTDVIEGKCSWFKRIIRCINCCNKLRNQ